MTTNKIKKNRWSKKTAYLRKNEAGDFFFDVVLKDAMRVTQANRAHSEELTPEVNSSL